MKNIILGITIGLLMLCANTFAQTKPTDDEKAIYAVMTGIGAAWEARDVNKFGEYLTDDCTHIDPHGLHSGRETIKKHMQWVIDTLLPKTKSNLDISDMSLRFVAPDAALFSFRGTEGGQPMRQTYFLAKGASGWKVASFQLTMLEEETKPSSK